MSTPPSMFNTFTVTVDAGAGRRMSEYAQRPRSGTLDHPPPLARAHARFPGDPAIANATMPSARSADPTVAYAEDQPALHYPHAVLQHRRHSFVPLLDTSVSPSASSLSPCPSSASVSSPATNSASDSEDAWNLVPYHVSWGHEYEEYRAGTLPGPDGDCIFLRSPTPLRNQRASEACKKCRERKAKCSGTRPSCVRCSTRNYACEYASEAPVERSTIKARRLQQDTMPSLSIAQARESAVSTVESPRPLEDPSPARKVFVKDEDLDTFVTPYSDQPRTPSAYWEGSTPSDDYSMEEPWQFSEVSASESDALSQMHHTFIEGAQYSDNAAVHPFTSQTSILAPQPIRHSSVSHLAGPADDMLPSPYAHQHFVPIQPPVFPMFNNLHASSVHYADVYPSSDFKTEPSYGVPLSFISSAPTLGYHPEQHYGGALEPYHMDVETAPYAIHISSVPLHAAKQMPAGYPSQSTIYASYPPSSQPA